VHRFVYTHNTILESIWLAGTDNATATEDDDDQSNTDGVVDVSTAALQRMLNEVLHIPVEMAEEHMLRLEVQSRRWCDQVSSMLTKGQSSVQALARLVDEGKTLNSQVSSKLPTGPLGSVLFIIYYALAERSAGWFIIQYSA
jgi:hypothetical protein